MEGFNLGSVVAHIRADATQFLETIGGAGAALGAFALVAGAAFSLKEAVEFNKQMTMIQTQAGASKEEMQNMSAAILAMGGSVTQGPIQLAEALFHIESAGYRGAEALDILKTASEGAMVGNADLEKVTNALVATVAAGIGGFQGMSGAMGVLNAIIGSGNMRMDDLTGAISTGVLPAAKNFGLSLQDVGAALDTMTINGIPAEEAATRLRMTFSLLAAPTDKAKSALESIGITSDQLGQEMRSKGLIPALTDLHDHLIHSGLDATQQSQVISDAFGGGKTSAGIMTLVGNLGTMQKSMDNIKSTSGDFSNAVTTAADTPAARWSKFTGEVKTAAVEIGGYIAGFLEGVAAVIGSYLSSVRQGAYELTGAILFVVNFLDTAYQTIIAITKSAYNSLISIWQDTWAGIKGFAERIYNDVTGFFSRIWHDVSNFASQLWHDVVGFFSRMSGDVLGIFRGLPGGIMNAIGDLGGLLYDAGARIIQGLINGVASKVQAVKNAISSVVQSIKNFLPFSPAKEGPLSGDGNPELSGASISHMFARGIVNNLDAVRTAGQNLASATLPQNMAGGTLPSSGMMGGMNGGTNNAVTTQINGPINIGSQQDADYFFKRLTRNQELANQGMTSIIGSLG